MKLSRREGAMVTSDKRLHTHASHLEVVYGTDVLLLPSPSPGSRSPPRRPAAAAAASADVTVVSIAARVPPSQLLQFLYLEGKGETEPLTIYKFSLRVDIA